MNNVTTYRMILCNIFILALICSRPQSGYCQINDVDFVIEKIISDYPGYKEKTKGFDFRKWAYETAKSNSNDTFKALSLIVGYFKDEHLRIRTPKKNIYDDISLSAARKKDVLNYLKKPNLAPREGFWINDYFNCVVALRMTSKSPETFEAIVVENSNGVLLPGVTLGKLILQSKDDYYTDYRSPYNGNRAFLHALFRNDSVFTTAADSKWRKIKEYSPGYLNNFEPKTDIPKGEVLDSSTYLLTIPICLRSNIELVDSIVRADSSKIGSREILIIDIRRNVGGNTNVMLPLIPWIYTNPIYTVAGRGYVTEWSIEQYKRDIDEILKSGPLTPEEDSLVIAITSWMQNNKGSFRPAYYDTLTAPEIRRYPRKVGLILDYGCQSAAELLTLNFLQSEKVTTFGEHTRGAVDYLSFYPQETVSKKYMFYIATSKRVFEEGGELDEKGIYPMVPISDNVPDWVGYVKDYLKRSSDSNLGAVIN